MTTQIDSLSVTAAARTVWVFGAGASLFYEVPSQARLLDRLATMNRPGTYGTQARFDELKKRIEQHIERVLPGLEYTDSRVSLEEVFSSYELQLADARSSAEEMSTAHKAISDLREGIRIATQVYGRGDSRKWRPHAREGTASPYAELIEKLFPSSACDPGAHTLVTFNYDINLDRCLLNLRGTPADLDVDYGFGLSNSRCDGAPPFDPPRADRSVLLLRTHGSLNWIRCGACESLFSTVNRHGKVTTRTKCYRCDLARLNYILVHPSYFRRYDDPVLRIVWGRTDAELVGAERWVFVGYSLPPADAHFRELLRSARRERIRKGLATQVVLVGHGPPSKKHFKDALETYAALFDSDLVAWKATANGFPDFVRRVLTA